MRMKILEIILSEIYFKREVIPTPPRLKVTPKLEFLEFDKIKEFDDLYKLRFRLILEYNEKEYSYGYLEYTLILEKEDKDDISKIKENYKVFVKAIWNRIFKDLFDILDKMGIPYPIRLPMFL